jgi:hypothetical protein
VPSGPACARKHTACPWRAPGSPQPLAAVLEPSPLMESNRWRRPRLLIEIVVTRAGDPCRAPRPSGPLSWSGVDVLNPSLSARCYPPGALEGHRYSSHRPGPWCRSRNDASGNGRGIDAAGRRGKLLESSLPICGLVIAIGPRHVAIALLVFGSKSFSPFSEGDAAINRALARTFEQLDLR